jgi:hypothetical protein
MKINNINLSNPLIIFRKLFFQIFFVMIFFCYFVSATLATDCNDIADGDSDDVGTWSCGVVPDADDDVTIDSHV